MDNSVIDQSQLKKLLTRLKLMTNRVAELEAENAKLAAENVALRNMRESDAAPNLKRTQNYLKKLAKARQLVLTGKMDTLGRSAIKTQVSCGDKVAMSIQTDLVGEGVARYTGGGHIKINDRKVA